MCESRTAAMRWSGSCLAATKNLVDDLLDRCRRVDDNSVLGDVGFCLMPSHDEFAIRRLSAAPLIVGSLVEPAIQGVEVDVEDEDAVEELDECREVPGTTAEEFTASSWSATKASTWSTRQMWCSCAKLFSGFPVSGSP